ncbi:MAG: RusA family crossover junction endodeoxyribonuclease [Phycisphaerae bacterium]|nr:RusA family crossover junction endodeoxyribonuclease [Phycisphaerae bacterium]
MTTRLVITVPGKPASQDRRTRQLRAKDGRQFAGTYLLPQTRKWREKILFAARRHPDFPREPWEGPIRVSIEAFFQRPKAMHAKKYPTDAIRKNTKPDADNLVKAVLDALTPPRAKRVTTEAERAVLRKGYMWLDDGQVHLGPVDRWYAAIDAGPGVIITVERIKETGK